MNDLTISSRLKALREKAGLSIREIASRLDMPQSGYNHYEYRFKKQYLPMDFAEKLADAYWNTPVQRDEVLALAGVVSENGSNVPMRHIPVYSVLASAGDGASIDSEDVVDVITFPVPYLNSITRANPSNLAIITVKGDSMLPTLAPEDVVMIDTSKTNIGFDGIFVIALDEVLHVKRVTRSPESGSVLIVSDNKSEYPPFQRRIEDIRVIGKVVWKGQRL